MLEIESSVQLDAFRSMLAQRGVLPALGLLNDRTDFRYTGIYKYGGDVMRAVHVYDRHAEHRTWLRAVPLDQSFCQYVLAQGEFATTDASNDPRLTARPYAGLIQSYYGRLLTRADGSPYGTFIHFDIEPRQIAPGERAFLQQALPLLSARLE